MKYLLLSTLILLFVSFSFGQDKLDCPTIKVIAPDSLIRPGAPINFSTALIGNFEAKRLEYKWTVSAGTISDGQSSPAITVATTQDLAGLTVTATVEVKGLCEGCQNSASGTGEIESPPPPPSGPHPADRYGKLPWSDLKVRLQNSLFVELANDPTAKAYLIFSITKDSERKSVLIMQKKILNFLKQSKIITSRILMKVVKDDIYQTTLWIVPEGAKPPNL